MKKKEINKLFVKRNSLIDIEKLLAIFLVVWAHFLTPDNGGIHFLLFWIHMPMFFFISGFFFFYEEKKYSFLEFAKKKFLRLFVPFLLWSGISLVFNVLITKDFSMHFLINETVSIFLYARSVWFFIALFILLMIMRIAYDLSGIVKIPCVVIMLLFYIGFYFVPADEILTFYKLKEFALFFILGYYINSIRNRFPSFLCFDYRLLVIFIPVLVLYALIAFSFKLPQGHYVFHLFMQNVLWLIGCSIGLFSLIGFAAVLDKCSITNRLSMYGEYSMDIYCMHMFFVKLYKILFPDMRFGILRDCYLCVVACCVVASIVFVSQYLLKFKMYRLFIGEK